MRLLRALMAVAGAALAGPMPGMPAAAAAPAPATGCDSVAGFPFDPQRQAPGVRYQDINVALAIPQCLDAVSRFPEDGRLQFQLGRALERAGRLPDAISAYRRAAALGHGGGFNNLGELYRDGKGFPRSPRQAVTQFERGAALNYPEAQYNLARLLLRLDPSPANRERAQDLLEAAARSGYPEASRVLQSLAPAPAPAVRPPLPAMATPALPGQVLPGQALPGQALPGQALPGQVLPGRGEPSTPTAAPDAAALPARREAGVSLEGRFRMINGQLVIEWGRDPRTGSELSMVLRSGRHDVPCEITPSTVEGLKATVRIDEASILAATSQADYAPYIQAGVQLARTVCPAIRSCREVATLGNPLVRGSGGMSRDCTTNHAPEIEVLVALRGGQWTVPCGNCQLAPENVLIRAMVQQSGGQASIRSLDDAGLRSLRAASEARAQQEAVERSRREAERRWAARWDAILASADPITNVADLVRHDRAATIRRLSQGAQVLLRFGNVRFQEGSVHFSQRQGWTNIYQAAIEPAFSWDSWNRAREESARSAFGFLVTCRMASSEIDGLRDGEDYVLDARLVSLAEDNAVLDCERPRRADGTAQR